MKSFTFYSIIDTREDAANGRHLNRKRFAHQSSLNT